MIRSRSRTSVVLIGALSAAFAAGTAHVVVPGDTLWDITGAYLGDPFQWPSVWQKNPQIADAHWIYPGDTIYLDSRGDTVGRKAADASSDTSMSTTDPNDPLAGFPIDPIYQKVVAKPQEVVPRLAASPTQSMLNPDAMRVAPIHYSPSELPVASTSKLDWGYEEGRHMIRPGTVVSLGFGTNRGAEVGTLMEVLESDERVVGIYDHDLKGRFEQIRGICVIVEIMPDSSRCRFERVYGDAGPQAYARFHDRFPEINVTGFEVAEPRNSARVVANTRNSRVQLPGNYVIIDRGTDAEVKEGDIFEFMALGETRGMGAMRGHGIVVRTTRGSATIFLVGVTSRPIQIGDRAWLVRKAVRAG